MELKTSGYSNKPLYQYNKCVVLDAMANFGGFRSDPGPDGKISEITLFVRGS